MAHRGVGVVGQLLPSLALDALWWSIPEHQIKFHQPRGSCTMLSKDGVMEGLVVLQLHCECCDVLKTDGGASQVDDRTPGIEANTLYGHAGGNHFLKAGEKLSPREVAFGEELIG